MQVGLLGVGWHRLSSTADLWRAFRDGWRKFEQGYRFASELFRGGQLSVPFPEHAFRPPTPLLG